MKTPKQIIERLASKELSFGCRVKHDDKIRTIVADKKNNQWWLQTENAYQERFKKYLVKNTIGRFGLADGEYVTWAPEPKILGHPVYINRIIELYPEVNLEKLVSLWKQYGIKNSLQEMENPEKLLDFLATL